MPTPQEEFEQIRWKLADDMDDHDIEVLLANKDKLNDEEKAAFSQLIEEDKPFTDDPLDEAINKAVEDPQNHVDPDKVDEIPVQVTPPAPTLPENVVTQDKLDSYIEKKREEWDAAGKSATEQKKEEDKIKTLFEEGYQPKDWNEYSVQFLDKVAPILEKRFFDKLQAQEEERETARRQLNDTQKKIFDSFEAEFATLAKNKLIPDPTTNPDEYKTIHEAILKIGDQNGKTNVTDAYKLWSIIPKAHGGGLDYTSPTIDPAKRIAAQKVAAGRIGKGSGSGAPAQTKVKDYNAIHTTSLDDLLEQRLQQQ